MTAIDFLLSTRKRPLAHPIAAGHCLRAGSPATAIALALLCVCAALTPQRADAAAHATGGTGQYRNDILWLTWGGGVNGTDNVQLSNGATTSASIEIQPGVDLTLNCTLNNVTGGSATGSGLRSYRPGGYSGDGLDDFYNIGGTGTANGLIAGIANSVGGEQKSFNVACTSTLAGQPHRIPGLVMADAESMDTLGTVDNPSEFLLATAMGSWTVVEMHRNPGRTYYARLNQAGSNQSIRFGPGGQGGGIRPSPGAITFLTFAPGAYAAGTEAISMDFSIQGDPDSAGVTAIAIGLLVPNTDHGDAPSSYGSATHVVEELGASPDGLPSDGTSVDIGSPTVQLGGLVPPDSQRLGSLGPDPELVDQPNDTATGDDDNGRGGASEEDAWPANYVLRTASGQPLNQTIVCTGTGTIGGWIDFDRNGSFDTGERTAAACNGGSAALAWTVPAGRSNGTSYVRLRYGDAVSDVALPTGAVAGGEVEDRRILIGGGANVSITKTNTPAAGPSDQSGDTVTPGQTTTYSLILTNGGSDAVAGLIVDDPSSSGLDCPTANPVTCISAATPSACPSTALTIAELRAGITLGNVPASAPANTVTLNFSCLVTP